MNVLVSPNPNDPTRGTLICNGVTYPCALGRSSVSVHKQEGDGATPVGTFPFRQVFFRAQRVDRPMTKLSVVETEPNDGWCDAPQSVAYNQLVQMPSADSAEALWRDDAVYDLIIVIGYNDAPVMPGKGSAIFMHVAKPGYTPTEGCVALQVDDLIAVLRDLDQTSTITIQST